MADYLRASTAYYDRLSRRGAHAVIAEERVGPKSYYIEAVFDAVLLPLIARDPVPRRLLDLGCGGGLLTTKARARVGEAVGVDASAGLLGLARRRAEGGCGFVQADGAALPFASAAFDCLVVRQVLCCIPDEAIGSVLAELARVAADGARLLLLEQVSASAAWQAWRQRGHTPPLTKRGVEVISALVDRAGFAVRSARTVRNPRFPFVFLFKAGVLPLAWAPRLARLELLWHERASSLRARRWHDVLFVCARSERP